MKNENENENKLPFIGCKKKKKIQTKQNKTPTSVLKWKFLAIPIRRLKDVQITITFKLISLRQPILVIQQLPSVPVILPCQSEKAQPIALLHGLDSALLHSSKALEICRTSLLYFIWTHFKLKEKYLLKILILGSLHAN